MTRALAVPLQRLAHGLDLPLPAYATPDSAGLDLRAAIDASVEIQPGARELVPTGIAIALPSGHEAQIRPRSGLALKAGITVLNSPATVDCDYRGEIGVLLINHGGEVFTLGRGDRIAQLVIQPVARSHWREVERLEASQRGRGGFGSTGT